MDALPGRLVPACGGTEHPFTVNGRRWLYCWHPRSGRHCYLNIDTDVAVWNPNFHPAHAPEYEHVAPVMPKRLFKQAAEVDAQSYYF